VKRALMVRETNEYKVLMLPGETPEKALRRYLDTGPDTFYVRTIEREQWIEEEAETE